MNSLSKHTLECAPLAGRVAHRQRAALSAALLAIAMIAAAHAAGTTPGWAEGRVLMEPRAGLPAHALERILEHANARAIERIQGLSVRILKVPPGLEARTVEQLSRNPHVAFAELDRAAELSEVLPNDPKFASGWHLATMGTPVAWGISTGAGVTVAVLDSGVDAAHGDLGANMLPGWNAVSQSGDTTDINGHGTQVAGTIAALTNNGVGVAAIAYGAKILPVRVSNTTDGWAYWSDIARGLSWAADNGASVANISYDVTGSASVTSAAQYMRGRGGVVVVAAGNAGSDPGYAPNASLLSVSATSSSDARTSWSNFGSYVDFAAPGAGIWTTKRGGTYGTASGTSFASPALAAVVALLKGVNPQFSPSQIEAILQQTAVDLGDAGWDAYYGFGRVNAAAAVAMAKQSSPNDSEPPVVALTSPTTGASVTGIVQVSASASDNFGVSAVELYVDGTRYDSDTVSPYDFSWDAKGYGHTSATLVARAIDEAGNKTDSSAVAVAITVEQDVVPPTVTLSNPASGAVVSGNVGMSASATDDVGVTEVAIFLDGALQCTGTNSASCSWNARKADPGSSHTVTARASDAAGNTATASATVIIDSGTSSGPGGKGGDDTTKGGGGRKNR